MCLSIQSVGNSIITMEHGCFYMIVDHVAQYILPSANTLGLDSRLCLCGVFPANGNFEFDSRRKAYIRVEETKLDIVRSLRATCRTSVEIVKGYIVSLKLSYSKPKPCNFCLWAAFLGAPIMENAWGMYCSWLSLYRSLPSASDSWRALSNTPNISISGKKYDSFKSDKIRLTHLLMLLSTVTSPTSARKIYNQVAYYTGIEGKVARITCRRIALHPNNGGFAVARLFLVLVRNQIVLEREYRHAAREIPFDNFVYVEDFVVNFLPKITCPASLTDIADLKALRRMCDLARDRYRTEHLSRIITETLARVEVNRPRPKPRAQAVRRSRRIANRKRQI